MPKKTNDLLKGLRTVDSVCKILTGKRLNQVVANGIEAFGSGIFDKVSNEQELDPLALDYAVLGVYPDSPEFVLKATFRAYVKKYHPDTGDTPDAKKYQTAVEAYDRIMKSRKVAK